MTCTIESRLLNKRQAAAILGVSVRTVERLHAAGKLRGYKLSERVLRFDADELSAWLDSRRTNEGE